MGQLSIGDSVRSRDGAMPFQSMRALSCKGDKTNIVCSPYICSPAEIFSEQWRGLNKKHLEGRTSCLERIVVKQIRDIVPCLIMTCMFVELTGVASDRSLPQCPEMKFRGKLWGERW